MSRLLFRAAPTELGPSHPVVESINVSRLTALSWSILGFNKAKSCLHLREFAKNSRIFAAFAPGANRAPQLFFPRKSVVQNLSGT